ncbi:MULTISPECIES: cellulose biosynthesis protein BcsQ [unclassified Pseudomonas]|uniref:cellulose biosynthesis protein BcsQ n=1 Tax=unclassified Pseudomonas TaxID=196821 RepID=UPI0011EF8F00|nr:MULTISPECIES: cellulose biosynthesis protein BcsQ [unclassified Pseudomonas]KAA0948949.1 cellulose synthase operon protein YhjQ [Pseudomonas sp. ANT_H4]KAA0954273.1 cellulose synthase operon protein YhjQ [Pseudomonas sp. ANT_H14]
MSRADDIFVLFDKNTASNDHETTSMRHFFEDVPVDESTAPGMGGGPSFSRYAPSANEQPQPANATARHARVVALVSVNGGVGRSTLVTALSSGLQRLGQSVLALDLDPQNALNHHFGLNHALPGIGRTSLRNECWDQLVQSGFCGCRVVSFGETDIHQQDDLLRWLKQEPGWLAQHLSGLGLGEQDIVIMDTPAGNNVYLHQALEVADVVLVIAQADAASLGTLEQMDLLLAPHLERNPPLRCHFVINQLDETSAFSLDMLDVFKRRLGDNLLEVVHRDSAISEALAFGDDPLDNEAASMACDDIHELCRLLISPRILP